MNSDDKAVQLIGLDIGRGYTKGYTEYNGEKRECMFKSVVSIGRDLNFELYEKPIYLEVAGENYFAGNLAELEGDNPIQNLRDDKTTPTAKKLIYAAIEKLAVVSNVKIVIGVPKKRFNKSELAKISETYKGESVSIKNNITGESKMINILDVSIFKEGDSALIWHVKGKSVLDKPLCMVMIGFRTTEISCYNTNMKFIDRLSRTSEVGNKTALEYVQRVLESRGIMKSLSEIDSSNIYDDIKIIGYKNLAERLEQDIEGILVNMKEVDVVVGGGTSKNLIFNDYKVLEDSQMITAKGLYLVAKSAFRMGDARHVERSSDRQETQDN